MRKFAAANRSLRSARQIPCTLCSRPACWYFCWYRGRKRSWRISLFQHRKAARQAQQVAARPFKRWADEWLAKKKVEKVKRGRIVAVRDPKTIEVLELRVGYVKDRFGKLCRQDIKRPDVLAFMRSYEAEGKLETRDRVRSIVEQLCRCRRRRLHSATCCCAFPPAANATPTRAVTDTSEGVSSTGGAD